MMIDAVNCTAFTISISNLRKYAAISNAYRTIGLSIKTLYCLIAISVLDSGCIAWAFGA